MLHFQIVSRLGAEECVIDGTDCSFGRAEECTVALPELGDLSRHHFRFVLRGGELRVEDLGSRHGTFVGAQRVGSAALQIGSVVRAAGLQVTILEFSDIEVTAVMPERARAARGVEALGPDAIDGFRLLRCVGMGGMGVVYAAESLRQDAATLPARVALKVLRPEYADSALAAFFDEMIILARMDHSSIVRFLGHGKSGDMHYLLMELVEGESARELLRAKGPLAQGRVMQIAFETVQALRAAWMRHQVVHGDLKPANMLVTAEGRVKLCDFGLAQMSTTATADRRGTAAYCAPELFSGSAPRSVAADFYSLGIALFQLLTGRLPFEHLDVVALRRAHQAEPLPSMGGAVSEAAHMVIQRLCAKDPTARYATHEALLQDLDLLRD